MHASSFTAKGAAPPEAKWQWERKMEIGERVNEEWVKGRESALWLTELAMAGLRPGIAAAVACVGRCVRQLTRIILV